MRFAPKSDNRFRIEPLSLTAGIAVRVKPVPPPRPGDEADHPDAARRDRSDVSLIPTHRDRFEKVSEVRPRHQALGVVALANLAVGGPDLRHENR